ncbi:hypothetical protein [Actinoplanes derwentensis]|uniref:Uncharacterized protein n=1 Tax=Actinoplanes derwentensis TaxID=113562 RepID=A0A1H1X1F2_9ACTN|nr:hypothetical protein [Actinoplanes derwentensis]GID85751.1 hypothetical protein Ade03nite_46750 [Actinoplanes derwentensis]SDT03128.1 hypothetical protein SAMN04489716_2307 [Actinoplanes derwentensis]
MGLPDSTTLGQALAGSLGTPVACLTGLPAGRPGDTDMRAVTPDCGFGRRTHARELHYQPQRGLTGAAVRAGYPAAGDRTCWSTTPNRCCCPVCAVSPATWWTGSTTPVRTLRRYAYSRSSHHPPPVPRHRSHLRNR